MATTANEYSTKPARILWHQYSRNPDNEQFLRELRSTSNGNTFSSQNLHKEQEENVRGLVHRLELLLRAANGRNHNSTSGTNKSVVIHDVVVSTDDDTSRLGSLIEYLPLVLVLYPEQVRSTDEHGNFPLHKAASNRPCSSNRATNHLHRAASMPSFTSSSSTTAQQHTTTSSSGDPVEILVQSFPTAAGIPNRLGLMPLHIALSQGRRTWRTGIACMVLAAPQALMMRCAETKLLPFQLAATMSHHGANNSSDDDDSSQGNNANQQEDHSIEVIETILELLLACPHAIICNQ